MTVTRTVTEAIEAGDVCITPCAAPTGALTSLQTRLVPSGARQDTHRRGDTLYTVFADATCDVFLRTVRDGGGAHWYRLTAKPLAAAT